MSTVAPRHSGSGLNTIDVLCDQFEEEWLSGREPRIEDFLELALADTAGVDRSTLLSELLAVEVEYRRRRGETPSAAEYITRFPNDRDALIRAGLLPPDGEAVSSDAQETVTLDVARVVQFRHFRLLGRVGAGHFGVVWRAKDTRLDRDVAIKVPRHAEFDPEETQRFLREARAVAQLSHRYIVAVHDVGDIANPYIVSDYIDGATLKDALKNRDFTARDGAELCAKIGDALEHAHQHGVVHRDIKPGNVILDAQGEPHIVDFGLARRVSGDSTVTSDGEVVGTPAYMSPEQASGRRGAVDARTDVYSLGMVLYRLLTGKLPFEGEVYAILHQVLNVDPKPPRTLNRAVPRDLETICLKALAKDRSRRYASAAEFAADLRRFLSGEAIVARRAGLLERSWRWCRRNVAVAISAAVILFAAGGVMAVLVMPFERDSMRTVTLATEPPGANVAFIPLHPMTGEPQPQQIIHAPGTSPVQLDLLPGEYMVVAYFDERRFHEVFRHVPGEEERIPGAWSHRVWRANNGSIELDAVKIPIPDISVTNGMAFIAGSDDFQIGSPGSTSISVYHCRVPSYYIDRHEFTVAQFKELSGGALPSNAYWIPLGDNYPMIIKHDYAMHWAEKAGKRLPTETEYEFAATARGTSKYPWGDVMPPEAERVAELGPVGTPEFDRLDMDCPVLGLCSNVAEWSSTWGIDDRQDRQPRFPNAPSTVASCRIVRGGDLSTIEGSGAVSPETRNPHAGHAIGRSKVSRGLGFRCVRSARPRLRPEDFVSVRAE